MITTVVLFVNNYYYYRDTTCRNTHTKKNIKLIIKETYLRVFILKTQFPILQNFNVIKFVQNFDDSRI